MKIKNLRHVALNVKYLESSVSFYGKHGFKIGTTGTDSINGNQITWAKLVNADGIVLELVNGWTSHMAFTVDQLDSDKGILLMPSGFRIQFSHDPDGHIIEYVEEPTKKQKGG